MRSRNKFTPFILALAVFTSQSMLAPRTECREVSKAGQVFQDVKDGVVTIFTSIGHGSGFLVDESGLIITNSHVINDASGHLRVRFRQNQVIEAKVIENDRDNDVAILATNLANIAPYKVLPLFTPSEEDLVVMGEKVLAIGSPFERIKLDKTMTEGIVGKIGNNMIYHDANINPGNSGGPLLNFDGQVVGINTRKEHGAGPGVAVPISYAQALLSSAKLKAKGLSLSPKLLADIPEIPYPISHFSKTNPAFLANRKQKEYNFNSNYFFISIQTPPQVHKQKIALQEMTLKARKKRGKKKGFSVTDDEYEHKNLQFYDDTKPVVFMTVIPNPKLTTGTKVTRTLGLATAATATVFTAGIAAPLLAVPFAYSKSEYKKDFLRLTLIDANGTEVSVPLESGREPKEKNILLFTDYGKHELVDKSYYGKYSFDAKAFDTEKQLFIEISTEGNDKNLKIKFPEKIKQAVVSDFRPYWEYEQETLAKTESKQPVSKLSTREESTNNY